MQSEAREIRRSVKKVLNSTTVSATIRSSESQQVSSAYAFAFTSPVRAVYTFSSCGRERMQRQLSTPEMPIFSREDEEEADLEAKPEKAPAIRSSSSERSIHLVPVLTVLCFVILFLCSHAPSVSDMSSFGGKAAGKPKSL